MSTSDTAPLKVRPRWTKPHGRRRRGTAPAFRPRATVAAIYLLTLVLDVAIVVAGASLLWRFAGSTVVDGPFWLRVCVFLLLTVLFGVRAIGQKALLRRLSTRYLARFRAAGVQLAVHTAVLVAGVLAWVQTGSYFLGWLVCFAACVIAVGYFWMLVSCLAVEQTLSMIVLRLFGLLVGMTGLIATSSIHAWADGIIESVVVLVTSAILLSTMTLFWGAALAEDTATAAESSS